MRKTILQFNNLLFLILAHRLDSIRLTSTHFDSLRLRSVTTQLLCDNYYVTITTTMRQALSDHRSMTAESKGFREFKH